jgi:hypothetical protein
MLLSSMAMSGYAPFNEIAPGLADLMYDEWKTNPATMVPYPDTPAVLKSFTGAGIPIAIVSNTGWSINEGAQHLRVPRRRPPAVPPEPLTSRQRPAGHP